MDTYTGATNIDGGTLVNAGTINAGSTVNVNYGTTLTNNAGATIGGTSPSAPERPSPTAADFGARITLSNLTYGNGGNLTLNGGSTTGPIVLNSTANGGSTGVTASTLTIAGCTALTTGTISGPASNGNANITYNNTCAGGTTLNFAAAQTLSGA